jgi:hypothetical protein
MLNEKDHSGTKQKNYLILFLHVLVPILSGILIYLFWRNTLLNGFFQSPYYMSANRPSDWVLYNLPDGLWLYAFLACLHLIWNGVPYRQFVKWLILAITLTFSSEFLQAIHLIPGTFDWYDLLAYSIASLFYFFKFTIITKQLFYSQQKLIINEKN